MNNEIIMKNIIKKITCLGLPHEPLKPVSFNIFVDKLIHFLAEKCQANLALSKGNKTSM